MESWQSIGGEANNVGSLAAGLLMTHLDIDLHIYTDALSVEESFAAVAHIASRPGIFHVGYTNLTDTEEKCMEWHALYRDEDDDRVWQLYMIHILRGAAYDGFAKGWRRGIRRLCERMAARHTTALRKDGGAYQRGAYA